MLKRYGMFHIFFHFTMNKHIRIPVAFFLLFSAVIFSTQPAEARDALTDTHLDSTVRDHKLIIAVR